MPSGSPIPDGPGSQPPFGGDDLPDVGILIDEDGYHRVDADGYILVADPDIDGCCCGGECDRVYYKYTPCPRDNQHINCPNRIPPTEPVYLRCDTPCPGPDACGQVEGTTLPPGIRFRAPSGGRWCYQWTGDQFYDPDDPPDEIGNLQPLPPGAIIIAPGSPGTIDRCTTGCINSCCACHAYICGQKCDCDQDARPTTCVEGWRFYLLDDDPATRCITGDCTDFRIEQGYPELPFGAVLTANLTNQPCCENCQQGEARCPDCRHSSGRYDYVDSAPCFASPSSKSIDYSCCCSSQDSVVEFAYESTRQYTPGPCQGSANERSSVARGRATIRVGEFGSMDVEQAVTRLDGSVDIYHHQVFLAPSCAPLANLLSLDLGTQGIHQFIAASLTRSASGDCTLATQTTSLVACPNQDGSPGLCTGSTLVTILGVTHSSGVRTTACRGSCGDFTDQHRTGTGPQDVLDILRLLAA